MLSKLLTQLEASKKAVQLIYQLPMGSYRVKHLNRVRGLILALRRSIVQVKISLALKEVSNYA
jgi:hypothetical protein